MTDHEHLEKLIAKHERAVQILEEQAAGFGSLNVPHHILTQIEDEKAEIARLRKQLGEVQLGEMQLAALPLDRLPERAALPAGSRMPFKWNSLFVGREDDLTTLAQLLKVGETAAIGQIAAATGLGGMGKTQLAVEFVHRYGQYFSGGVFWLSFAEAGTVASEVAACGGRAYLNLAADYESLDLPAQVELVRAAWQSPVPRLLVFDNCEEEELLAEWQPKTGGCRVVLTSRRGRWNPTLGIETIRLKVLPPAESVALLRTLGQASLLSAFPAGREEAVLVEIALALGGLPLALHLAGSFLGTYPEVTAADYLEELRTPALLEHESLRGVDMETSPTAHDLQVGRTFALSYERLKPDEAVDKLALELLGRAAYFAPGEALPRALLLKTVGVSDKKDERPASRAIKRLLSLGLVEETEGSGIVLHRLVGAFVRGLGEAGEAQAAVEETVQEEARQLNKAGYPGPLLEWQNHLRAVTERARAREDERAARLCNTLGYHLKMIGDYAGARPYFERALVIREEVLGPKHPDTAGSLNNLASLLQAQGDYVGARPYFERALAIRQEVLGPKHPNTASSLNNLASLLQDQGDYAGARPYYERALAIREEVLGPKHPDTAQSLNNLASLLQDQGDYAGARPYYERALAIREEVLGPKHPKMALSLNNLASLLKDQGDYAGARPYFERALAINEEVLGPEHPDMALSLWWMGVNAQDEGDREQARLYLERALAIYEKRLGPGHAHTQAVRRTLAQLTGG